MATTKTSARAGTSAKGAADTGAATQPTDGVNDGKDLGAAGAPASGGGSGVTADGVASASASGSSADAAAGAGAQAGGLAAPSGAQGDPLGTDAGDAVQTPAKGDSGGAADAAPASLAVAAPDLFDAALLSAAVSSAQMSADAAGQASEPAATARRLQAVVLFAGPGSTRKVGDLVEGGEEAIIALWRQGDVDPHPASVEFAQLSGVAVHQLSG